MKEYRLGSDGKLYNFNIDRNPPNISRIVEKNRWGDGSEEFPTVGQRYTYEIKVWGKLDDLDNKFSDTAEPEPPGDADADLPVPIDTNSLIPQEIIAKAETAIADAIVAANAVKDQVAGLLSSIGPVSDSREDIKEEGNNLRAIIEEAKRLLGGGLPEDFTPPTPADAQRQNRRLQSNGTLVNFNIDKTKPYRDTRAVITFRDFSQPDAPIVTEETNVRIYGELADLNTYYPLGG
jgi:hypothetical protein